MSILACFDSIQSADLIYSFHSMDVGNDCNLLNMVQEIAKSSCFVFVRSSYTVAKSDLVGAITMITASVIYNHRSIEILTCFSQTLSRIKLQVLIGIYN